MEKDKICKREEKTKEYRDVPQKYLQTDFTRDEERRSAVWSSRQFTGEHRGQLTLPDSHHYSQTHQKKHHHKRSHHHHHREDRHHHHHQHHHHSRYYYDNAEETSQPSRDQFPIKSQRSNLHRPIDTFASDNQFRKRKVGPGEKTVAVRKKTLHLDSDIDSELSSVTTLKTRSEYVTTELRPSAAAGHTAKSQKDSDMISTTPHYGTLIYNDPRLLSAYCSPSPHSMPRSFVLSGQSFRHRDERCTNIPPTSSSLASRPSESRVIVGKTDHIGKTPTLSSRQTMSYEQSLGNRATNVAEGASKSVAKYVKKYQRWRNLEHRTTKRFATRVTHVSQEQPTDGNDPDMFHHKPAFVNRETVTSMTEGGIGIYPRYDYNPYSLQSLLPVQQQPVDRNCKAAFSNLAELSKPMDTSGCKENWFDRKDRQTAKAVRMEKLQAGSHKATLKASIEATLIEAAESENIESDERGAGTEKTNSIPNQSTSKSQDHPRSQVLHIESVSAVSKETDAGHTADEDLAPVSGQAHATVHKGDKYKCHECFKVFSSYSRLKAHMRVHTGDKQYGCDTCGKVFRCSSDLRRHIAAVHRGEKTHFCEECGKAFSQAANLRKHIAHVHRGEKPHVCHECTNAFSRSADLRRHIAHVHRCEKPHFCEECGKAFSTSGVLRRHIAAVHRGEKPHFCQTCGKAFSEVGDLKVHMRVHTKEKPYVCYLCSKAFSMAGSVKVHIRVHTGEKPYVCQVCGKAFNVVGNVKRHMRVHTKEKPYECQTCGSAFSLAGNLKRHMRIHTGEKPYKCQGCRKAFRFSSNLREHERRVRHPYVHVRRTAVQNQCV